MKELKMVFILVFFVCLSVPCFARRNIELAGSWKRMEKSYSAEIPILLYLEDNNKEISIQFLENIGYVEVCVTASSGAIIYNMTIDSSKVSTQLVALDEFSKCSNYKVIISNKLNVVSALFSVSEESPE